MKRAGYYAGAVVLFLVIGVLILVYFMNRKPDFEIQSTLKNTFDNYEVVDLSVIVLSNECNLEEIFNQVYMYYVELNGEPDELRIRLFKSKLDYNMYQVYGEKQFIKK